MLYALVGPDWHDLPISTRGLDFQWISNYLHTNLFGNMYSGFSPSSKSMSTVRCNCAIKASLSSAVFRQVLSQLVEVNNLEIQCF